MKFTLAWLSEHLDTDAGLTAIADRLTALGVEVEGVHDRARGLEPFTVAHVIEAASHPNADRLRVCRVDTGKAIVQVVCGAPNARTGMKGVFAPAGSVIPGTGLELKRGVIRGVESNGMLCSAREMGLGEEHDGIIELPADAPIGQPFAKFLELDDPVIEVAVTPNRPDCLGVRGIARDLAAAGLGSLKPLDETPVAGRFASPVGVTIGADTLDACPVFAGRTIRGVANGESPRWLKDRLAAIGLRPISALVDITNLLTYDRARPLHVFDADSLAGALTIRGARAGERLLALNGKEYALEPGMTVIADQDGVLSLGGIIGGEPSGVTEATTNVFLECALFDPRTTAATGRALGIESDARYRFERGVDPAGVLPGIEAGTKLIQALCGGEASQVIVAGAVPDWRRAVNLRPDRLHRLGGLGVPENEATAILSDLGFTVAPEAGHLSVAVPSWRPDIEGEADLVEEVLRVKGYDAIPPVPLTLAGALPEPAIDLGQRRAGWTKRALAARGYLEAVTYSFASSKTVRLFGADPERLAIANPISAELDVLRPTILVNLVEAAARNGARGAANFALFEVGPAYRDETREGQLLVGAGLRYGETGPRDWRDGARPVGAFDAKADALAVLASLGVAIENLQVATKIEPWYHPGRAGTLNLGPTVLAQFGELHPRILRALGIDVPIAAFEIMLDSLPAARKGKAGAARPLLKPAAFQPVTRDFAFLVDEAVPAEKLLRAARGAEKGLIASVNLFDVYRGAGVPAGQKSLAVEIVLQPTEKPMTDGEIEAVAARIVGAVAKATGASLRS